MSDKENISDEEIEKLNEESVKVYQTPTSSAVPGLKNKKYKCSKCGEIIDATAENPPEHCGTVMEIIYE